MKTIQYIISKGILFCSIIAMICGLSACSDDDNNLVDNSYTKAVIAGIYAKSENEWKQVTQVKVGTAIRIEGNNLSSASAVYFNGKEVPAVEFEKSGNTYIEVTVPQTTPLNGLDETLRNTVKVKTDVNEFVYKDLTIIGGNLSINGVRVFDGPTDEIGRLVGEAEIGTLIQIEGAGMDLINKVLFNGYGVDIQSGNRLASTALQVTIPEDTPLGADVADQKNVNTIDVVTSTGETLKSAYSFVIKGPSVKVEQITDENGNEVTLVKRGSVLYISGTNLALVKEIWCNGTKVDFTFDGARLVINVPADLTVGEGNVDADEMNKIKLVTDYETAVIEIKFEGNAAPPVINSVSHTMARAGEFIYIWGENLDEVKEVIFPGNVEAVGFEIVDSKTIKVTVPEGGDMTPGCITLVNAGGKEGYSYNDINCRSCLFLDFASNNAYAGSSSAKFAGITNTMSGTLSAASNPFPIESTGAPAAPDKYCVIPTEPRTDITVANISDGDNYLLKFRVNYNKLWSVVVANSDGLVTNSTPCKDLAIEFDYYMTCPYSMGAWRWILKGYSGTEGKDRLTVAPWNQGGKVVPVEFYGGWRTMVMPLAELSAFENLTVAEAAETYSDDGNSTWFQLLAGNFQDAKGHWSKGSDMANYQLGFGNFRLVPYVKPESK
ncbi:glycan-binding surface protein [uncultured Bacteroides sp.]|uniref:glycan-binding surface protein n=1 Tax=uncultured Bacteroides sp. TaxID=162156 RepID=UPI0026239119|nr:glycan-binding surface protein [uncultured Bacteroides sp.]